MNHNTITVGSRAFTGADLKSGSCYIAESIAGEELSIDTLEATVESAVDLTGLPYGEAVTYQHDNALIGKFFLSSVKRAGASAYDLSCVSAVGLLAGSMHLGGLYTGQMAAVVLADIIGGMVEYTVDDKVKSVKVYGWLPYATRRDNLHQLLFAVGASITKTVAGTLNIKYLTANDPKLISTDRLYAGGSIDHSTPATEAQVTEHVYFASANDQTNTLFDNTDGSGTANNQLVTFDGPHHDLTASAGLTIVSSGVNHAVLSGTGTLTGKAYSHQTKIISKQAEAPAGTEHVVSVTDATLVSPVNSSSVAERVLAYYSGAYHATMGLVVGEERPGDSVRYTNPFEEVDTGLIKSMDINISNTLKADATITGGYVPTGSGNDFEHVAIIDKAGTWTVPAGVKKIRAVLISGGAGGNGGTGGTGCTWRTGYAKDGAQIGPFDTDGTGGAGGESGPPGTGGKVFITNLTVTPGQSFTVSPGAGGAGGTGGDGGRANYSGSADGTAGTPGEAGSSGGATRFGSYSSDSGAIPNDGYYELFSGAVYAEGGGEGFIGGKGGGTYGGPKQAESLYGQVGGSPGRTLSGTGYTAQGGGGGGCAFGADGHAATPAVYHGKMNISGTDYSVYYSGFGGDGAKPIKAEAGTTYGAGGQGGHGGGGAGNVGAGVGSGSNAVGVFGNNKGTNANANGGEGGEGGDGAPGCVIIYY